MTIIKGSRIADLLHWHDDKAGDQTTLFVEMTNHRDTAALIRQLQAELQDAWHAGLDEGREQGRGKDHAHPSPIAPVGVEGLPRYGFPDGNEPRPVPCANGYWTPWHLAQQPAADPFEREYRAARAAGMGFEDAWHAAIKTEQQPAAVDDAMVLVPREPTPAILEAFSRMDDWLKTAEGYRYLVQAAVDGARGEPYWKAMIEAAQPGGSDNGR